MKEFEKWWEGGLQFNGADEIDKVIAENTWRAALEWAKKSPGLSQADWMRIKKELKE